MLWENKIWFANNKDGEAVCLLPQMATRHGLITGAENKEVDLTARVLAESFSELGVPVFMADINRNLAGMINPGTDTASTQKVINRFDLKNKGFDYRSYPVTLWDIYGQTGLPLRATVADMGPDLMAQILGLNELEREALRSVYLIAAQKGLLLIDINDLKSMTSYVHNNLDKFMLTNGLFKSAAFDTIIRKLVIQEDKGLGAFFGETALNIIDFLQLGPRGEGVINILDANQMYFTRELYASVILWMLCELTESLPVVPSQEKPKMAFFIDEAQLLFRDANAAFLNKAASCIRLLRNKGVSVFLGTESINDVPEAILGQLQHRIQHAPNAWSPEKMKDLRILASLFPKNPAFDT